MVRLITMIALCGAAILPCASSARAAKGEPALVKEVDGAAVLRSAGVTCAADIESVVIPFIDANAYKIARRNDREWVQRLYESLDRLALMEWPWMMAGCGRLILNTKSGKTLSTIFSFWDVDESQHPKYVFLAGTIQAPDLVGFLRDLRRNPAAAKLDDGVGPIEVRSVEVGLPGTSPNRFSASSDRVKPVLEKALLIVDSLDPRASFAVPVSENEMNMAKAKFGAVTIDAGKPVRVEVYLKGTEKPHLRGEDGLFRPGIERRALLCTKLVVMEFGNYPPPVVILQDASNGYYLFAHLKRRLFEGWVPGPAFTPPKGYVSPGDLYRELRDIAKTAYEGFRPEADSGAR